MNQMVSFVDVQSQLKAVGVLFFLVSIVVAIWMYHDVKTRGKSGLAAAMMGLCSVFYDLSLVVMVVCAWILVRPGKIRRRAEELGSDERLELPSSIRTTPSPAEFLKELEENS